MEDGLFPNPDRLATAVLFSLMAHALLLFGIHFKPSNPDQLTWRLPALAVTVVNIKGGQPPLRARQLAQTHSQGGGDERARDATSPQQADVERSPAAPRGALTKMGEGDLGHLLRKQAELERRLEALRSDYSIPRIEPSASAARGGAQGDSAELARISARIERETRAYQGLPRRVYLGPQAREHGLARYIDAWRRQIEAYGNRHYPEKARGQHGSVSLLFEIRADGQLESIRLERSSGSPVLDQAAQEIVRRAAPFEPFTAKMRERADRVVFSRSLIFTREAGISSEP